MYLAYKVKKNSIRKLTSMDWKNILKTELKWFYVFNRKNTIRKLTSMDWKTY